MDDMNKKEWLFEAKSLCYYNDNEKGWNWTRLADIENDRLVSFQYDSYEDSSLANRNWLRTYPEYKHSIGDLKVISWHDEPNNNGVGSYNKTRELDIFPIEIYDLTITGMAEGLEMLRNGIAQGSTTHDIMYTCGASPKGLQCILCKSGTMERRNGNYILKSSNSRLPYYYLNSVDIFTIRNIQYPYNASDYKFLVRLNPGAPAGYLRTREVNDIVKSVLLESRMLTWRTFGDFTTNQDGTRKYTQRELQLFKSFINQANDKSAQQEVAEQLGCSEEEAEGFINDFIDSANSYLDGDELDTQLLSRLVAANDAMREKYTELVKEKWQKDSDETIKAKEREISSIETVLNEKSKELKTLTSDIDKNQKKLRQLQEEIENNNSLAEQSYSVVQNKIAEAKQDVSRFLGEMAFYLPSSSFSSSVSVESASDGDYCVGKRFPEEQVIQCERLKDLIDELSYNLGDAGIPQKHQAGLAALLYAAYCGRTPLLLAGYNGEEVGHALSASVEAKFADVMTCSGKCNRTMIHDAFKGDGILIIRNPFCGDWLDTLIHESKTTNRHLIFCHPYVEDLAIEPQSLFNYMLPIYMDEITENTPNISNIAGARLEQGAEDFEPKVGRAVSGDIYAALKVNKMLQNKMQTLFTGMRSITDAKQDELIYAYLLPSYADAVGRGEQLCFAIKGRSDVSQEIKKTLYQHFNYEEE